MDCEGTAEERLAVSRKFAGQDDKMDHFRMKSRTPPGRMLRVSTGRTDGRGLPKDNFRTKHKGLG
ncbi:hypothetical protein ABT56_23055 [Photobacterium aquae]|uniref:Uncharacterized protein n=1 Tax=Photobacterium aquae TaxID=1195763 RepID=A0A0J1GH49_9GAMM|nr:hypothetical protein ABT56_23055 [Photobacterium aquae]